MLDALAGQHAAAVGGASCASILEGRPGSGTSAVLGRFGGELPPASLLRFCCTTDTADEEFAAVRGLLATAGRAIAGNRAPRAALTDLLADGPVTVLVDDAQWCDVRTLRLFGSLLRGGPGLPLCLVLARVAAPRAEADAALAEIASMPRTVVLALGRDEAAPVARRPLDLAERLDGGRAVVLAAAVLGDADHDLVAALSGLPAVKVEAAFEALRPAGAFWTGPARARLLETVPEGELAERRASAARLLDEAARPVHEVAELLVALPRPSEPWMRATLAEAADAALHRGRIQDAARFLRPVLAGTPLGHPDRELLARALLTVDPGGAATEFAALAPKSATPAATRAAVALFAAAEATRPGETGAAMDRTKDLLARVHGGASPRSLAVAALVGLAASRKAATRALSEVTGAASGEPPLSRAEPAVRTAMRLAMSGRQLEVAVSTARGVLRHDRALSSPALLDLGAMLHLADDIPSSVRALDAAVAGTVSGGDTMATGVALAVRSLVLRESGEPRSAAVDARVSVLGAGRLIGSPEAGVVRVALAAALYFDDELAAAERVLRTGAGTTRADGAGGHVTGHRWETPLRLLWLGRISARRGDWQAALLLLAECGRWQEEAGIANPVLAPWWFQSALTLVESGKRMSAARYVEIGRELAERWPTPRARGLVLLAEGAAAAGEAAVEALDEACRVLATSSSRLEHARAEYLLGKELLRRGDRKGARRHLRSAASLCENAGWQRLAVSARDALGSAGGRMTRVARRSAFALTERERAVAGLVARGASNREVAKQLFVSARTVELDLTNVYRKLAVDGRAELPAALDLDGGHRDLAG
ncbi:LuxR family transcriptional regulator [Amycolatopsis minnesotensis]|uniref:LuxR family transcriptional regulator n=1 Tax=Amycolatopsis minnesotensis TaxID=337894 RepID=A0ABN2QGX2_9PSEU